MARPISVQLSSTIESDDLWRSLQMIVCPWRWRCGRTIAAVEHWFRKTFKIPWAVSFNSGRSALYAILQSFGIGAGDEVLLQAFTCVAVPNAVRWLGARPVYVDTIPGGYIMSVEDLKKKITKQSKAIIIQHTFGYPDDVKTIVKLAKKNRLILIEDCAHSLGNRLGRKRLGMLADAAFFSFGRDKVVSSVFGGMAIAKSKKIGEKLRRFQKNLPFPSHRWIAQQLFHPLAFAGILPIYPIFLGKVALVVLQKLKLLSRPLEAKECQGDQPKTYPQRYPNALAVLALGQLVKIEFLRRRRRQIASLYWQHLEGLPLNLPPKTDQALLRFPIQVYQPDKLVESAKRKGIILGRWYSHIIDPAGVELSHLGYTIGSCPNAEELAKRVVNLPTAPVLTDEEIMRVIVFIFHFFRLAKKRSC